MFLRYSLLAFSIVLVTTLFLPVLTYSASTPFGLIDDYFFLLGARIFDSADDFCSWVTNGMNTAYARFRPVYDLQAAFTSHLFGEAAWLHHLSRWLVHFLSVALFASALMAVLNSAFPKSNRWPIHSSLILLCVWIFFPNSPASRLTPLELPTVFFLALINHASAYLLVCPRVKDASGQSIYRRRFLHMCSFGVGYFGLCLSKEVNVSTALFLLIFYFAIFWFRRELGWRVFLCWTPLLGIFLFTAYMVYGASVASGAGIGYGHSASDLTISRIVLNIGFVGYELLQVDTSYVIALVFAALSVAAFALGVVQKAMKWEVDIVAMFVCLVIGEIVTMLAIVGISWAVVLRYWYVVIPPFATLLVLGAALLKSRCKTRAAQRTWWWAIGLFVGYFVAINYYNFLWQTAAQHGARNMESDLIVELDRLCNSGEYVYVLGDLKYREPALTAVHRVAKVTKRMSGRWPCQLHEMPPTDGRPYYLAMIDGQPTPPEATEEYRVFSTSERDYPALLWAKQIARSLQGREPMPFVDGGVHILGEYSWTVYRVAGGILRSEAP